MRRGSTMQRAAHDSAQHMRPGLVYRGPMFYLARVKVVQMCTGAWVNICVSTGASKSTHQHPITNVIDELWQAAASLSLPSAKAAFIRVRLRELTSAYPYVDDI